METPLWVFIIGIEFPAVVGFLDCIQRPAEHFPGFEEDKKDWTRWLIVAMLLVPILLGYGILMGYYFVVVRRNAPGSQR
jgi:hypothetical protein